MKFWDINLKNKIIILLLWVISWIIFFIIKEHYKAEDIKKEILKTKEKITYIKNQEIINKRKELFKVWLNTIKTNKELNNSLNNELFIAEIISYNDVFNNFYNKLLNIEKYNSILNNKEYNKTELYSLIEKMKKNLVLSKIYNSNKKESQIIKNIPSWINCNDIITIELPYCINSNLYNNYFHKINFINKNFLLSNEDIDFIIKYKISSFYDFENFKSKN